MRLSACFLSCLLSRPQPAVALQRNTRPSTHDASLPVYGQETPRPLPLPHYRAGKISFFLSTPSCWNYIKGRKMNALKQLGTNKTWIRTSGPWSSYFPSSKIGKFQFPFFFLPSKAFVLPNLCVFMDPDKRRRIYFMVKNIFLRDNRGKSRAGKICPSCPLANSVVLQKAL